MRLHRREVIGDSTHVPLDGIGLALEDDVPESRFVDGIARWGITHRLRRGRDQGSQAGGQQGQSSELHSQGDELTSLKKIDRRKREQNERGSQANEKDDRNNERREKRSTKE